VRVLAVLLVVARLWLCGSRPSFLAERGLGAAASCASNLRQIHLALMMYVDDYDGRLPLRSPCRTWWGSDGRRTGTSGVRAGVPSEST